MTGVLQNNPAGCHGQSRTGEEVQDFGCVWHRVLPAKLRDFS